MRPRNKSGATIGEAAAIGSNQRPPCQASVSTWIVRLASRSFTFAA